MNNVEKLIELLTNSNKTISSMESCTGGCFSSTITNYSRSSEVLKYSAVTYSNEYKIKMGVNPDTIDLYSVYSIETAHDMSKSISEFSNSNYGIGITGKINREDKNNKVGSNNKVYVSIYNKDINKYFDIEIICPQESRLRVKNYIVNKIIDKLIILERG